MVLSYPSISRIAGKICCNISSSSSRHTTSLLAMSLVSIGLGFSQTRCCHKPYRLVNHQCAVQRLITAYVEVNVHMYNFISLNLFSLIHAEFYACNQYDFNTRCIKYRISRSHIFINFVQVTIVLLSDVWSTK